MIFQRRKISLNSYGKLNWLHTATGIPLEKAQTDTANNRNLKSYSKAFPKSTSASIELPEKNSIPNLERESTFQTKLQPVSFKLLLNETNDTERPQINSDEQTSRLDNKFFHPDNSIPSYYIGDTSIHCGEMSLENSTLALANSIQKGGVNLKNVHIEFPQFDVRLKNSTKSTQAYEKLTSIKKTRNEGMNTVH